MADIFFKGPYDIKTPITADKVQILWDGKSFGSATNVSITYSSQVTRKYSLGTAGPSVATVYPGRPIGQMTIGHLFIEGGTAQLVRLKGFDVCGGTTNITLSMGGGCTGGAPGTYTVKGAYVISYSLQADADSLLVMDNLTVEFLELDFA